MASYFGDRKQVQNKRFDRHQKMDVLIGSRKQEHTLRMLSIESSVLKVKSKCKMRHVEKVYSVKTKSTVNIHS